MNRNNLSWTLRLDQLIEQKHMLLNPFYRAWSCGHLTRKQLQDYSKEYYAHVKAFPTYISALHSRCEDPEIRKPLLHNLIDEEAGSPNHPDLWRSFSLSLGCSSSEIQEHRPSEQTKHLVNTFMEICRTSPLAAGVAALYCYESQIPAICTTKIEGLRKWYGLISPEQYRYFSVHETADVEHSRTEKELLQALVQPQEEELVLAKAGKTLDALNEFLVQFV